MDINTGDHFFVKVNGTEYDTVIDHNGTQRFAGNPIVSAFITASTEAYNAWLAQNPIATRNWDDAPFTLNNIDYQAGSAYTLNQLIEFSTLHGYSVSGLCDLSFMADVEVINPIWE